MPSANSWITVCLACIWALLSTQGIAQLKCGTEISERYIATRATADLTANKVSFSTDTIFSVPIKFHIIRSDDGVGGIGTDRVAVILDSVNNYFAKAHIEFIQCGDIEEIHKSSLRQFHGPDEEDIINDFYNKERTINIYFMDSVYSNGTLVCGYSYMPGGPDHIFITNACAEWANTVQHELGHYFSLIHTHGLSNAVKTDERVDGSNCTSSGDYICDTPADPMLSGAKVDSNCEYIGTEKDADNQAYRPMTNNIMSYSIGNCVDSLTQGQYEQMFYCLFQDHRIDLNCTDDAYSPSNGLIGVYPNPFEHEFRVEYDLKNESVVSLELYDHLGRAIEQLFYEQQPAGKVIRYVAMGDTKYALGVYYLRLQIANAFTYQKIVKLQ